MNEIFVEDVPRPVVEALENLVGAIRNSLPQWQVEEKEKGKEEIETTINLEGIPQPLVRSLDSLASSLGLVRYYQPKPGIGSFSHEDSVRVIPPKAKKAMPKSIAIALESITLVISLATLIRLIRALRKSKGESETKTPDWSGRPVDDVRHN